MPTAIKKRERVPDMTGMKVFRCAKAECNGFLGYEDIVLGFIRKTCHHHKCKEITQVSRVPDGTPAPERFRRTLCACGRYLYDEALVKGRVRVKCEGCGEWHTLVITP